MSALIAFIHRPIMATAINLVLLVIGLVAFNNMELRHVPNQAKNEFRVDTHYPGANSLSVEQRITKPLEDALSGLDGLRKISSESMDGKSEIHVKFKANVNNKAALSELRDRIMLSMSSLPENVKRPEVQEQVESSRPILYMSFEDPTRSVAALSDFLRRSVEDRLRLIDGVSQVTQWGNKLYEVTIELDPAKLMNHQVSTKEVVDAIKREKTFASGGEIERESQKETVVLSLAATHPKEFEDITVKSSDTHRVRVADVAEVHVTQKPTFLKFWVEGQDTIGLQIYAKPAANPLEVTAKVRAYMTQLQKNLPSTMKTVITYDGTNAFKISLKGLERTLWEAVILVGLIVIVSLASFRAALLPMITVPLCLIGSFALMWGFGFSINPITLLALVLAVGLVVDDAIVVVENIYHHMESGLSPLQAAKKGMKEISFSIVVMTITLAAVYLPIAFQSDDTAVMFREFAATLAGSVIISGFVALTLTPALCGKFLKHPKKIEYWERLNAIYKSALDTALQNGKWILTGAFLIAVLGIVGFCYLNSELMPVEDEDFVAGSIWSETAGSEALRRRWLTDVEAVLQTVPERTRCFMHEWQERWLGWGMTLQPRKDRQRGAKEIAEDLKLKFKKIVGPEVSVQLGEEGGLGGNEPLKIVIQYPGEYQRLVETVKTIQTETKKLPEFDNVYSEQVWETPRLQIKVDKALSQELGVGMDAIEDTLYTLLSGKKATEFSFNGFDYDVNVRAAKAFRSNFNSMNAFFVAGGQGQWIPLGSLVYLKETLEPSRIKHYDRMRGASISLTLKPGISMERAMEVVKPILKAQMPEEATFRYGGAAEKYKEARQAMWFTYGLALLFIYLVLAALFESVKDPLIVLLTVPLSVAGAVWAVHAIGGTNNIYTAIGLVTLVGLITKHGILIVDFANRLRAQGLSLNEAVVEAAVRRLRPILMTTLAMIFGAFPLVFSLGAGAIARHHIGWVIIGGMLSGTFFSLFVVPVVYQLLAKRGNKINIEEGDASNQEFSRLTEFVISSKKRNSEETDSKALNA